MRLTIKLGGSILEDARVRLQILEQVAGLGSQGHQVVLVHGGGKSLSRRLEQLNLPSHFLEGLRVTDEPTLKVALMVLAGEVNKSIVAELGRLGARGVGICGADASAVRCVPMSLPGRPEALGFVGSPTEVDGDFFDLLLAHNLIPVVSSMAVGEDYGLYNINADQMAAACAGGTRSEALVYLTDVPGVRGGDGKVYPALGSADLERLRESGAVTGGMLPKIRSCLEALRQGVSTVYIVPGASVRVLEHFMSGELREGTRIHDSIQ